MKNYKIIMMAVAMVALLALGACKKEVAVDKLCESFKESVIAEQRDSGNVLTVDTVFLNQTTLTIKCGYDFACSSDCCGRSRKCRRIMRLSKIIRLRCRFCCNCFGSDHVP